MKLRLATAKAHSTPAGASTPSRDKRFGLPELHHQRVSGLLEDLVGDVLLLAARDDVVHANQLTLNVQKLLGCLAVHQSNTASRRMSSSRLGLSPP